MTFILLLLLVGLVLLTAEIFVAGFGIMGILGIAALVAASVMTCIYVPFGIFYVGAGLVVLGVATFLLLKKLKSKQYYDKLILKESLQTEPQEIGDLTYFLGKTGVACVALKPVGIVDFNGVRLDVFSNGEYIREGSKVKVVDVTGTKIIVTQVFEQ